MQFTVLHGRTKEKPLSYFYEVNITLMPKSDKDWEGGKKEKISDHFNYDAEILNKILAKRSTNTLMHYSSWSSVVHSRNVRKSQYPIINIILIEFNKSII